MPAVLAEMLLERLQRQPPDLLNRLNSQPLKRLARDPTDSPEPPHRQGVEELLNPIRLDYDKSIGLFQVAGDLGQELIGSHSHRSGQPQRFADFLFDAA